MNPSSGARPAWIVEPGHPPIPTPGHEARRVVSHRNLLQPAKILQPFVLRELVSAHRAPQRAKVIHQFPSLLRLRFHASCLLPLAVVCLPRDRKSELAGPCSPWTNTSRSHVRPTCCWWAWGCLGLPPIINYENETIRWTNCSFVSRVLSMRTGLWNHNSIVTVVH